MDQLRIEDLRAFVEVVERGSFTGAANRLRIPKATLSRRLSRLEEAVGVRLLHRTSRSVGVTEHGRTLFERARTILRDLGDILATVSDSHRQLHGKLRVTAPADVSRVRDLLLDFAANYPRVQLELELTMRYVDIVATGFDVAIRAGQAANSSLIHRKVGQTQLIMVAHPEYLARAGVPRDPDELQHHDCIVVTVPSQRPTWLLQSPSGVQRFPVHARLVVNELHTVRQAALQKLGLAILPKYMCDEDLDTGRLCRVLEPWEPQPVPVFVVYPDKQLLAVPVRAFVDFVAEHFPALI